MKLGFLNGEQLAEHTDVNCAIYPEVEEELEKFEPKSISEIRGNLRF